MSIKYLLSDLDGVIRTYPDDRARIIEQKFDLPEGSIFSTAFEKTLLTSAVCGHVTDEVWRSQIVQSISKLSPENIARSAIQEWSDFAGIVDQHYLQFLKVRFTGVPVVILTNGTTRLKSDLIKLGIDKQFFRIFNSAELGFCKPDKKIYSHVIDQLGCAPGEVLFVDDSLSHIKAAQEIGMVTHHYQSLGMFKSAFCTELE